MQRWKVLSSKRIVDNSWMQLDEVFYDTGRVKIPDYYLLRKKDFIGIIVEDKNCILLLKEYRAGIDKIILNIPMGDIDPQETSLHAAKRELLEETGCQAKTWKKLGVLHPAASFVDRRMHVFHARDIKKTTNKNEKDKGDLDMRWFTLPELRQLINKGTVQDMPTIAAVYLATNSPR